MSRLIDADALKEVTEFHPTSVSVCMTVEEARGRTAQKIQCLEDIDNAPTIEAIPVEWLFEHSQISPVRGIAVRGLVDEWQKEQEAR